MGKRWVDTIRPKLNRQTRKKYPRWLVYLLILIVLVFGSFFYVGRLGADYLLQNIEPISLLKDGKYLVLFQNNAELRSSGGFIGSYAVLKIANYEIENLSFNTNIFATDRAFTDNNYVEPPPPLKKFLNNQSWALRDSNYDASFPQAAQDILRFYQVETADNVDGIIALNATVLVELLKLTGPITLDKYAVTVSALNFYDTSQYQIEKDYFRNPENWVINEPKTFLKDLYPEIISRAFKNKMALAKLFEQELEQKEILFYFCDPAKQQIAENHNWAGKIPTNQELKDLFETSDSVDYLYINSNSYSGDKSSIKMKESIDYRVAKNEQGNLVANLKLTRIHTGSYVWPDGPNDTWIRVFVPKGSLLLNAKLNEQDIRNNLTVGSEAEKTFFGLKNFTNPGQVSILEFSYIVPASLAGGPFKTADYHLLVQKQPGVVGNELSVSYLNKVLFNGLIDIDKKL